MCKYHFNVKYKEKELRVHDLDKELSVHEYLWEYD